MNAKVAMFIFTELEKRGYLSVFIGPRLFWIHVPAQLDFLLSLALLYFIDLGP